MVMLPRMQLGMIMMQINLDYVNSEVKRVSISCLDNATSQAPFQDQQTSPSNLIFNNLLWSWQLVQMMPMMIYWLS